MIQEFLPSQASRTILIHKLHCSTNRILARNLGLTSMLEDIVGSETLDLQAEDQMSRMPRFGIQGVEINTEQTPPPVYGNKTHIAHSSRTCRRVLTSWARSRCPYSLIASELESVGEGKAICLRMYWAVSFSMAGCSVLSHAPQSRSLMNPLLCLSSLCSQQKFS